jgi:hypothetical protein
MRVARTGEATTRETPRKRRSGFVPFLVGVLFVAALLAVVGRLISWKTYTPPPSISDESKTAKSDTPKEPPAKAPKTEAADQTAGDKPSPVGPETGAAAQPPATQPVNQPVTPPVNPPESTPAKNPPAPVVARVPVNPLPKSPAPKDVDPGQRRQPARNSGGPQDIQISSSPGGAVATLDGNSAEACTTPCSLNAPPGNHTVAVTMSGYQIEHRYVTVGSAPLELPPIVLHATGGTLMLSSDPPGATVLVDGRRIDQLTPATISLPLGTYSVTLEKDGRKATTKVEVRNGINFRKILLGQ